MPNNYRPDQISLSRDPNLNNFVFDPGSHANAHNTSIGQGIFELLTSRLGVAVLMGAVIAAPSRPPVIATEPFVLRHVGTAGFTDEMKKYAGRLVRWIIEHLGGRWVRRGVKVTVTSAYGSGSIYTFR
ncbi:hypothetical protein [Mesorhizobium sp. M8A.F.Ca.ET.021.01.1.1]|uniref:hypothetical protein n=1 Tax=Mesorhizobium sp. M8A.F.Ca.ET.021.01.1.1 TaxID=2496757 RepID=UPI00167708D8|nr:hypothetical protein [Mesorhizobium sp. M8A.F.Ca.ET.021.01.1.1]